MRVLIVCSGNGNMISQFISDQITSLKNLGIECKVFVIKGKGIAGYLNNLPEYYKVIKEYKPDIIHAHYVLSGLFAVLQFKTPVVMSFIGSDILLKKLQYLSRFAMLFSKHNIFVSQKLADNVNSIKLPYSIIQYGLNLADFFVIDRATARKRLGLKPDATYCLFPASRKRIEKNFKLANDSISTFDNIEMLELGKGYTKEEVNLLYNACDFLILTSLYEGGPQVVKEAMSCNIPVVSTDVGDVKETFGDIEGCFICSYEQEDVIEKVKQVLKFGKRINGRKRIEQLNIEVNMMAEKLIGVYEKVLEKQ